MVMNQQQTQYMYGGQTSAFETAATPSTVLARVQSFTPVKKNNFIYDLGLGEGYNYVNTALGTYDSGGTVVYNPVDFDFLKHWIGPKSGSGTVGTPYALTEDDVVGLTTGDIQVFTFEDANTTEATKVVTRYVGCTGDNFTLSGSIGSKVTCSATFLARHPDNSSSTPTAYTAVTGPAFNVVASVYSWGATPTQQSGVQSFTIDFSNNLNGPSNRDIEGRFIAIPVIGFRSYKITFDIKMTSAMVATFIADHYSNTGTPNTGASTAIATADLEFKVALNTGTSHALLWFDACSIDDIEDPKQLGGGLVMLKVKATARIGKDNIPIKWWTA